MTISCLACSKDSIEHRLRGRLDASSVRVSNWASAINTTFDRLELPPTVGIDALHLMKTTDGPTCSTLFVTRTWTQTSIV
jgi:hypothetical protein